MKFLLPAIFALIIAGTPTEAHAETITRDAMKARSIVVTGDRCDAHADELNEGRPDILQNRQCWSISVPYSRCKITIPYSDRGRCHAEYEVRDTLSGRWWLCDRNLRWRVKNGVIYQRKSRWWKCDTSESATQGRV